MRAGQPFGAVCTVPANVTISGGAVTPFTISVSTLASAAATPVSLLVMLLASRVPANRRYYRILVPALNAVGAMLLAALLVFPGSAAVVAARRQHLLRHTQLASPRWHVHRFTIRSHLGHYGGRHNLLPDGRHSADRCIVGVLWPNFSELGDYGAERLRGLTRSRLFPR